MYYVGALPRQDQLVPIVPEMQRVCCTNVHGGNWDWWLQRLSEARVEQRRGLDRGLRPFGFIERVKGREKRKRRNR